MKKYSGHIILVALLCIAFTSCRTAAPPLDYKAIAHVSIRLGMDIGMEDNHALYVESANWIGVRYRSGGNDRRGVDCSGLTCQVYKKVYRKNLKRTTTDQLKQSRNISKRKLREGDLVFFTSKNSRKKVAHVGIYLKNGKFVHASSSRGVIVSDLNEQYYRTHWLRGGRPR